MFEIIVSIQLGIYWQFAATAVRIHSARTKSRSVITRDQGAPEEKRTPRFAYRGKAFDAQPRI